MASGEGYNGDSGTHRSFYEIQGVSPQKMDKDEAWVHGTPDNKNRGYSLTQYAHSDDESEDTYEGGTQDTQMDTSKLFGSICSITLFILLAVTVYWAFVPKSEVLVGPGGATKDELGGLQIKLENKIQTLQELLDTHREHIDQKAALSELDDAKQENNQMKTDLDSLKIELEQKIQTINSDIQSFKKIATDNSQTTKQIEELEASLKEKIQKAAAAAASGVDTGALDDLVKPIEGQVSNVEASLQQVKGDIATTKEERDALVEKTDGLSTNLGTLKDDLSSLSDQQRSVSDTVQDLSKQHHDASQKIDDLSSDVQNLQQKQIAQEKIDELTRQISDLKTVLSDLQDESKKHNQELTDLQDESKTRNQELTSKVDSSQNELSTAVTAVVTRVDVMEANYGDVESIPVNEGKANELISSRLEVFAADKLGKIDYALKEVGGDVVEAQMEYQPQRSYLWPHPYREKNTVIQASSTVGDCWPMEGSSGHVTIKLREAIVPSSVSVEHISRLIAPAFQSAPKRLEVWGVKKADDGSFEEDKKLKSMVYVIEDSVEDSAIQSFDMDTTITDYEYIRFKILSNYGSEGYTCLYRFRVHGKPIARPGK